MGKSEDEITQILEATSPGSDPFNEGDWPKKLKDYYECQINYPRPRGAGYSTATTANDTTTTDSSLASERRGIAKLKCFSNKKNDNKPEKYSDPDELKLDEVGKELLQIDEKAYQRAFFLTKTTKLRLIKSPQKELNIEWLDMEIPADKSESLYIDLIGRINKDNRDKFILTELKGEKGESPFSALYQAIKYAKYAESNRPCLKYHPNHSPNHNYWKDCSEFEYLIIAAPDLYWSHRGKKGATWRCRIEEASFEKLGKYNIIFAEFDYEEFGKQRGEKGKSYKPFLLRGNSTWREL